MLMSVIGLVFVYMTAWYVLSLVLKRNDFVDVAWGLGFVIIGWYMYFMRPTIQLSLALMMVTIWGVRLSTHIFLRNIKKKTEDYRYKEMRDKWGKFYLVQSYVKIYLVQGILMLLVASSIIVLGIKGRDSINVYNLMGLIIWSVGFTFESVSDYQLRDFISKSKNKGRVMDQGLWRYSRHPNYFGEIVQWWGIWLVTFGTGYEILGLIGPITITLLITKVSGIPLLEKRYKDDKGYQKYAAQTSKLIPMKPKGAK